MRCVIPGRLLGLDCCHPVNPLGKRERICCDFDGRVCAHFPEDSRDCFWPDFTHPRWLRCRILYGCKPLVPLGKDFSDPDRHDGRHHNRRHNCRCCRD
ncbi:hypothetical protein CCDG5_1176 [[Clostridium] cellulosi]|uniref:Uncharacterized protein n=1 Tax=[Clostridium] cellulosi TaxID=29343 RepID=A0A078KKS7_9FIRM|nr:hypothetical protein CCDG5_1176 [[Clostridium] cellulosi]